MGTRISKVIADSGVASRRGAEELISLGLVSVNGNTVTTPVCFVEEDDVIEVRGKKITQKNGLLVYMFHKPINTMTTTSDPQGRKTIYDCLPAEHKNLKYVGRLDFKTTGLLLLTNDGEFARKMTLPSSKIPRTYIATVSSRDFSGLDAARAGITVDGIKYSPMKGILRTIKLTSDDEINAIAATKITASGIGKMPLKYSLTGASAIMWIKYVP
jgi:23S rRNA pseudouridine2605 synthase